MTAGALRSAGEPFAHEALLYSHIGQFLTGTLAFVREGLARGHPVLVAVPEPRLSLVRAELGGSAHRVRFVDMADEGRNPNRILPWVLTTFVEAQRPRRARIVGESLYRGRAPEEVAPCVQHEALVNIAFARVDVAMLCPYDVRRFPHAMPYVERTHPVLVCESGRRHSTNYTEPQTVVALLNQPLLGPKRVTETVIFDAHGLANVRMLVAKVADAAGLGSDAIADLQLAVSEVGANAVTHSGATTAMIRMWSDDERMVCEIRGAAHLLDPMAGRVIPEAESECGRGLLIANRLCHLVQTYCGPAGMVTRLHMRLPRSCRLPEGS